MPKVVIVGGGVAGLTAAHEMAERGFEVVLIEKTGIPGGKARSSPVMPVGESPWKAEPRFPHATPDMHVDWVPGEHGFRFFPGFYRHVTDSMSRIPVQDGTTAADHLVPIAKCEVTQYGKPSINLPARFPRSPSDAATTLAAVVGSCSNITGLAPHEIAHFAARIWQIMTSCAARRLAEYEKIGWWEFIDADTYSPAYQKFLGTAWTRSLVAAKARTANTRTIGNVSIQLQLDIMDPLSATIDRVLDGPTNQVWIYPWLQYVRRMGTKYLAETEVKEILVSGGRISGVRIHTGEIVKGDYYVCALPVERFAPLITPELCHADPTLQNVRKLAATSLEWMNGVQFYFRRPLRMVHGHMTHIDTEWALTSISQTDVWRRGTLDRYGPENIQSIVSVDVSDWKAPAANGRCAIEHSRKEVGHEVWSQLKRSVNLPGEKPVLCDEDLVGMFIDSDIDRDPSDPVRLANAEPLLVNLADSWRLRPEATTAIPNLFLASDYVRTETDLATMEGANEAARRAVNAILEREGFPGSRCQLWSLFEPITLAPLRSWDALRFGQNLPWDAGYLVPLAVNALKAANPMFAPLAPMLAAIGPVVRQADTTIESIERSLPPSPLERPLTKLQQQVESIVEGTALSLPTREIEQAATEMGRTNLNTVSASPIASPPVSSTSYDFTERLGWYRAQAMTAVLDAIPSAEPQRYLYEPIREFVARPSKGLRPAIAIATSLAYGGNLPDVLPFAAGIELLHNAFLVHDDIEDGSESRRGCPTMHRTIGTPLAINAGDAMNALAMRLFRRNISDLKPETARAVLDDIDHMLLESLEGQSLELGWVRDNNCGVSVDDYLRLVLKKTAWYSFIHPMRIGALLSPAPPQGLERFHAFGFLLGAAFQIQDDVLNLLGEQGRYGKEIGGDLWEGKRTLAVAHAFDSSGHGERTKLRDFFSGSRSHRLPRQVADIQAILQRTGSIDWTKDVGRAFGKAAQGTLPSAFAGAQEGPDLAFLRDLSDYVVARDM